MASPINVNANILTDTLTTKSTDKPLSDAQRQQEKLKKAAQDFEGVFIGMMLKQMRKSMAGSNALFGKSSEAKMYQDMMDEATANQMAKTGTFGLAKKLCATLEHTLPQFSEPNTDGKK